MSGLRNCGVRTTLTGKVARAAFGVAFDTGTRRCRTAWFPREIRTAGSPQVPGEPEDI